MHNFLCRLFFYVLAIMFLNTAFGSWPESDSPLFYFAYYGSRFIPYVCLLEGGYQIAAYLRRRNAPDALQTTHLPAVDADTRPIDKP